jgi:hypothetical protein
MTTFRFKTRAQKLHEAAEKHEPPLLEQSMNIIRVFADNAERFPEVDTKGVCTRDDFSH